MHISVNARVAHHALKPAVPLALASVAAGDLKDLHWVFQVLIWVVPAILGTCLAFSGVHLRSAPCPYCKAKTPAQAARWHNRLFRAYGLHAGPPLAVGGLLAFILTPLLPEHMLSGSVVQAAVGYGIVLVICSLFGAYLSARRYLRVNCPEKVTGNRFVWLLRKRGTKLMHRAHWLYVAAVAVLSVAIFGPDHGPWGSVTQVLIVIMVGVNYADQHHGRGLCEECVTSFRPDAAEYAEARKWRFTLMHKTGRALVWLGLLAIAGVLLLPHPWGEVGLVGYYAMASGFTLLTRFHGAYQPWCPFCRGGGGDGDEVPEGSPEPSTGRPVPA